LPILESLRGIFSRWGGSGYGSPSVFYPGSRIDYAAEAGDPWANSVVALGLKWLGDRFPRPPMQVSGIGRDGKFIPLPRHDLVDLWQRPNGYYTGRTLSKAVGLSVLTSGNAYVYKARDGAGRVAELWWLPHFNVEPTWDGDEFISGYSVDTDKGRRPLAAEDVIHIRDGIDPHHPRKGLSTFASLMREMCAVNEEGSYNASLLRNRGVPGLMIIPDDPNINDTIEDVRRTREKIREAITGDNRGETVVFKKKYRVEQVGFSPREMSVEALTTVAMAKLASATGVALMSMGLPDPGKSYANFESANRYSWGSVVSVQELIAESLRYQLLPEFKTDPARFVVEYDYSQITEMQESLDALWKRVAEGFRAGLITQNEGRDLIGQQAVPDGDRWFPGTGDPAEIEREQEEDRLYSGAISRADEANDAPEDDAAPEPSTNGDGNGRMRGGKSWRY
jgi:HK97 family phage portal protein